ncbi:hypothetical protein FHW12_003960 [Dokdonella fugitiva]|uniref:Amidohydrolase family protein n=1 Tax=Dokdonella fugitiva TaxID=328517 RepID=A0A839F3T8_9GAMM|nr:amidohydrolase family protein [Dokdonella fugitiva]MBA8889713.1 hypothetical protein [Dokdonella fugitiva]
MSIPYSPTRRRLLGAFAAAPLAFTGCCALRRFPAPLITDTGRATPPNRILRPEVRDHGARHAVDAHAHFFNASDVNVAGYVEHCIAHSRDEPLRTLIRAMAPVLDALAGNAKTAAAEYAELIQQASGVQPYSAGDASAALDRRIEARRDDIARELYDTMRRKGADTAYARAKDSALRKRGARDVSPQLTPERIRQSMALTTGVQPFGATSPRAATSDEADGVLRFASYMLQDRWMNLRTYARAYSTDAGSYGIDAAFGALVDFDYWLDCAPYSSRSDQMKLHSLLSYLSGGYMLPLIGYNPWTDIKRDGESLALVKEAIGSYGFVGVKLYPPTGFFPYGNADHPVETPLPRPDLRELDRRLATLFDWCVANEVPVMAHSNHSMGRDDASDAFGGTVGWTALEARYEGKPAPSVSLSHFGGDANGDGDWPARFAGLMARYPQAPIYGDLAYWSNARTCGIAGSDACAELRARIEAAKAAYPAIGERLMYGSDWLMLAQERDWEQFPAQIASAVTGTGHDLLPFDALFRANAVHFFGLDREGPQRSRAMRALAQVPAWFGG